jgi:squalene-hopene/tetraprenyl-beta-curcumene cyclase
MKAHQVSSAVCLGLVAANLACAALAAEAPASPAPRDLSLRNEVQHAIDKGLAWLAPQQQQADGYWSTADHPAVTALALMAFHGEPTGRFAKPSSGMKKGQTFLLKCVQPDGGIYVKELANYNTSVALTALLQAKQPELDPVLRRARAFLVGSQIDLDEKGKLDSPFDGGVGYGSKYPHSDLNNTLLALEALYHSKPLVQDPKVADARDLDWQAAIRFLQNCQNLPSHNSQDWADGSETNKGGFIYYPGQSMAGAVTNSGRVAYRSYGSASYAGLLSYIYADLKRDDPRVTAVLDWLRANYTTDENPGMGPQGLYYYLHTMTKALTLAGVNEFELKGGRRVNWRREVALKLLNLQASDGSWANDNARWWEKDPVLATSYSVMALEIIYRGL